MTFTTFRRALVLLQSLGWLEAFFTKRGIRCLYVAFTHCKNNYNVSIRQVTKEKLNYFGKFKLFATLALFWPVKKEVKGVKKLEDKKKTLIENADNLFENGQYNQCYTVLLSYEDGADVEVNWRIVRALYNMAKEPSRPEDDKKEIILKAFKIISDCLKTYGDHFAVHKWYALLLDAKSGQEGTKQRINQLENVKKHMDTAASLNPKDATTLYMLGEWCYQITDMPTYQRIIAKTLFASPPHSTYEEALDYFLKAEAADPRFYSLNLLMIGKTYLKLKKDDQAKYYLGLAASYPAKSNDDHGANKEAAELLKKLK